MSTITARINVSAAQKAVGLGSAIDNIAKELRVHGIPAKAHTHGIKVDSGELHVYEENGLRVFEWTPPPPEPGPNENEDELAGELAGMPASQENAAQDAAATPAPVEISKSRKRR